MMVFLCERPHVFLSQDESTIPSESAAGQEGDRVNGASGSSGAAHHGAGPKKRRHRIPKQEKDKDPQVWEESLEVFIVNNYDDNHNKNTFIIVFSLIKRDSLFAKIHIRIL